jgi:hypothetical protein
LLELDRKRDEARGLLDLLEHQVARFAAEQARRPRPMSAEPPAGIEWLRSRLAAGYMAAIRLPIARLRVPVPATEIAGNGRQRQGLEPAAFVVEDGSGGSPVTMSPSNAVRSSKGACADRGDWGMPTMRQTA